MGDYCFAPPKAPRRQDLQIPKPVPLAWMKLQSAVIPANSEPAGAGPAAGATRFPLRKRTETAL